MKRNLLALLLTASLCSVPVSAFAEEQSEPLQITTMSLDEIAYIRTISSDELTDAIGKELYKLGVRSLDKYLMVNYEELGTDNFKLGVKCVIEDQEVLLATGLYDNGSWTLLDIRGIEDGAYYYVADPENYTDEEICVQEYAGPTGEAASTPSITLSENSMSLSLEFGELLDANPNGGSDGNTLVIKAKISPSYSNKATVDQNYHNIIDLVKNQNCDNYSAIDYWAVADMTDGSEGKVISFLVSSSVIKGIKEGNIVATTLDQYLNDLWILPSLNN